MHKNFLDAMYQTHFEFGFRNKFIFVYKYDPYLFIRARTFTIIIRIYFTDDGKCRKRKVSNISAIDIEYVTGTGVVKGR